jgi:transketolase
MFTRHWDARDTGERAEAAWTAVLEEYRGEHPELAGEFERRMKGELPAEFMRGVDDFIAQCVANESDVASRKASQQAIAALAPTLPELLGGSADLAGSNLTLWPEAQGADASDAEGQLYLLRCARVRYGSNDEREFHFTVALFRLVAHSSSLWSTHVMPCEWHH